MTDLIARLEEATEGSEDLSDEVLLVLGWWKEGGPAYEKVGFPIPDPTRSVDDCKRWVESGAQDIIVSSNTPEIWTCEQWGDEEGDEIEMIASTEPLARCAAALRWEAANVDA